MTANPGFSTWVTNRVGHGLGTMLAKVLWSLDSVKRMAVRDPLVARIVSEAAMGAASLLELPGNHPLMRIANNAVEALAAENLDQLEAQTAANPPAAEAKVTAAVAGQTGDVFIFADHVHKKENCKIIVDMRAATATTRVDRATGRTVAGAPTLPPARRTTFADAMDDGTPLCGRCYPSVSTKAAPKDAGPTLAEHFAQFQTDHPVRFDALFAQQDRAYWVAIRADDKLERKFHLVFHRRDRYKQLEYILIYVGPDMWGKWLEMLMDEPDEERWREREFAETRRAIEAIIAFLRATPAWAQAQMPAAQQRLDDALRAEREADEAYRKGNLVPNLLIAAFIVTCIILAILKG